MKKIISYLSLLFVLLALVSCTHSHSLTDEWAHDDENHWHVCEGCDDQTDTASHTFGDWKVVKEATESEKGLKEKVCSVCSYKLEEEVPVLEHTHSFSEEYSKDESGHWYACSCGQKNSFTVHRYGEWEVTKNPTETTKGSKKRVCSICDYEEVLEIATLAKTTVTGSVSNVFAGKLEGCNVELNGQTVQTNAEGKFVFNDFLPQLNNTLVVQKSKYETIQMSLSNEELTEEINVDLPKEYSLVGSLVGKKWTNYEAFVTYVSRNSQGMLVKLESNNTVFTSQGRNSWAEVYFVVGDNLASRNNNESVTQVTIYSDKSSLITNLGGKNIDSKEFNVTVDDSNGTTTISVFVPYGCIGMEKDEIIGISCGLWSEVDKDWAPMFALQTTTESNVELPSQYVRCDKENYCFSSPINDYPENIPAPEYNKEELIKNYKYGFADPNLVKVPDADDMYLNVNKTSTGFVFDIIGFGTFASSEYIKLILHTSSSDGAGWAIQASDVTFLISSTKAIKKTGITDFWACTNFSSNDTSANNMPKYELKEEGYFTLQFTVDFTEIPEYKADKDVSFMILEFGAGVIYNNDPYKDALTINGVGVGDPALQSNYQSIQSKEITVDKDALIASYNLKFSTNYYAKIERLEYSVKLSVISFETMNDTDFVRFVVDTDATPATHRPDWPLDEKDVSFTIYKDKSYVQTNETWFWTGEAEQFHKGNYETLYTPEYTDHGQYWTLTLEIDYTEFGASITKDSKMTGLVIFFNPGIQNNGFMFDGVVPQDVANQSSYFAF